LALPAAFAVSELSDFWTFSGFSVFLVTVRAGAWKTGTGIAPFLLLLGALALFDASTSTVAAVVAFFFFAGGAVLLALIVLPVGLAFVFAGASAGCASFAETFFNTRLRAVAAIITHFMSYQGRTNSRWYCIFRLEIFCRATKVCLLIEISWPHRGCGCPKYGR
jgi:hypothetical protein